jgi:hypothetical protein
MRLTPSGVGRGRLLSALLRQRIAEEFVPAVVLAPSAAERRDLAPSSQEGVVMEWLTLMWYYVQGPVAAALIIGLFWAALAHPERIRSPIEFRLSALCLAASVVATVLIPLALLFLLPRDNSRSNRGSLGEWQLLCAIPPVLMMLAVLLGIDSVMAKRTPPDA